MRANSAFATVAALVVSSLAVMGGASRVVALSYPTPVSLFPACSSPTDEFCVETFEFTGKNGVKTVVANPAPNYMTDPTATFGRTDPYVGVFLTSPYSGPASVNAAMPTGLAINYYDPVGSTSPYPPTGEVTLDGLKQGLYRVVVRTGDYDPTIMMLSGNYESLTVTKDSDGTFMLDLSVRPTPIARVVVMDGDRTALDSCIANKWLANCEANQAYRGYALASFGMLADADLRESMRGTWISTNASVLELTPGNFLSGEFNVNAQGPHYVPVDFGIPGMTPEGSREVNSAFFEMFVTYAMMAKIMSSKTGMTVTVDMVKTFLDNPGQVVEGTIEEATSPTAAVVEKLQTLSITRTETGARINFNLVHFSAPNPTLRIKSVPVQPTKPTTPTTTSKKLANGATLKVATKATKGRTVTGKALLSPSKGATVTKLVSRSNSVCKVTGTSVKMLKKGTCTLSATVKVKSRSTTTTVSIKVS